MDWKEFFKPNKWKIILAILLFFLIILSSSVQYQFVRRCEPASECPQPLIASLQTVVVNVLGFPASLEPLIMLHDKGIIPNEVYYNRINRILLAIPLGFIPNIIYLYVLSCLIIYIVNKLKSKK